MVIKPNISPLNAAKTEVFDICYIPDLTCAIVSF